MEPYRPILLLFHGKLGEALSKIAKEKWKYFIGKDWLPILSMCYPHQLVESSFRPHFLSAHEAEEEVCVHACVCVYVCVCMCVCVCICMLSHFVMFDFLQPLWTVSCQDPLSKEFSRQEYWSGLPFPTSVGLTEPGIKTQDSLPLLLPGWGFISQSCETRAWTGSLESFLTKNRSMSFFTPFGMKSSL